MKTEDALQLAKELIMGPRAKTYGDKIRNHCNIAKLWTASVSYTHLTLPTKRIV